MIKKIVLCATILSAGLFVTKTFSQEAKDSKDHAQFPRMENFVINEYGKWPGIMEIRMDDNEETKMSLEGNVTHFDYLNYDSNTFPKNPAEVVAYYTDIVTKLNGTKTYEGESITCGDYWNKGAIFKISNDQKTTWAVVLIYNDGNYKLILIE